MCPIAEVTLDCCDHQLLEQVVERANELSLVEGATWQTMLGRATFVVKKNWHTYNQVGKDTSVIRSEGMVLQLL